MKEAPALHFEALLLTIVTAVVSQAYCGWQPQATAQQQSAADCSTSTQSGLFPKCTEDPSCVLVGETHILEWKSPTPAKIIVVCIHGLGLCARAYSPLAREFSAAGIDGFAINVRGFGPDRDKAKHSKLNCLQTVRDAGELLAKIHKEKPDHKVFLIGESMGGAIAIRIAAEYPGLIDGIVCSAPAWKLLKTRQTAAKGVIELLWPFPKHPGMASRGVVHQATTDKTLSRHWLEDSSHKLTLAPGEARDFMSFIGQTDTYARQLNRPILIIQGLNDHLVSNLAVARLFQDIPEKDKTFLIDCAGEHVVLEEGEFSPPVVTALTDWLKTKSSVQNKNARIEVINDQFLSAHQKQILEKLKNRASIR
ncbi:MAG: alpha/beta fold hydrolase [Cyanobacteria bacterium SZAS LIN-3]|nr:alpha/beta fold hydrolase [Cyanobacteria bacterium SZAS LIN-3]